MYKNRIHIFSVCYNESHFVKQFLAAYKEAERIIIFDNYSTDNSVELFSMDHRVEIRYYDSGDQIRDDIYFKIKRNSWRESKGFCDWVIVVDIDEIFQRAIKGPLFDLDLSVPYEQGYTVIRPFGYNMNSMDAPLYAEGHPFQYSQKGTYHDPEEKLCCFRPDQISELNYIPGCHGAKPEGNVKILFHRDYKLLHYKFWNFDHYMESMATAQKRLSEVNKRNGWATQYMNSLEWHKELYINGVANSKYLFDIERDDSRGPNPFYQ